MSVKARLSVTLKADETVVAESEDTQLWQDVLVAINTRASLMRTSGLAVSPKEATQEAAKTVSPLPSGDTPEGELARELGVSLETLQGALDPIRTPPYVRLNRHHWEPLKKLTPERGRNAVSPLAVAATLLILWKEKAGLGDATVAEAKAVLFTIDLTDRNAPRALRNCKWLMQRDETLHLHPGMGSEAQRVAKQYCTAATASADNP